MRLKKIRINKFFLVTNIKIDEKMDVSEFYGIF